MQTSKNRQIISVHTKKDWRKWLEQHHDSEQSVWVVCNTKKSGRPVVEWSELVDEALCFGWIDSTRKTIDKHSFRQLFSRRKPNGTWSKINKEKVERLISEGLMTEAGYKSISIAKQNGSWTLLDSVEELQIPADLDKALRQYTGAEAYFTGLSKSVKKMLLQWIVLARRPETRQKRIDEIAVHAARSEKPKLFR